MSNSNNTHQNIRGALRQVSSILELGHLCSEHIALSVAAGFSGFRYGEFGSVSISYRTEGSSRSVDYSVELTDDDALQQLMDIEDEILDVVAVLKDGKQGASA